MSNNKIGMVSPSLKHSDDMEDVSKAIIDGFVQGLNRTSETKDKIIEAKKKYLEIVSYLEDKAIIELRKENNLLPIRELDAINSMMANIVKF